jgi:TolB-like protein/DNA-binding winged helix-turn-helix (wHTH) protein/predicted Zn-dependent protease
MAATSTTFAELGNDGRSRSGGDSIGAVYSSDPMSAPGNGPDVVRFGEFTLDVRSGELSQNGGQPILLPYQAFRLLTTLIGRSPEVVTRDDLRKELWANDTFVDFEHSLNAAIRRLRDALGDSASAPRFIETLPRRGYRFIAPVERNSIDSPAPTPASLPSTQPPPTGPMAQRAAPRGWFDGRPLTYALTAIGLIVVSTVAARSLTLWRHEPPPVIAVLPFKNLSPEPESEYFVDGLTDEIIRNLSEIDGLEVRSETSSFTFKNKPRNTHEVGTALQAGLIVEGSVLRESRRVRVNARLVRVADDVPLWSGHFDRQLEDVFAIQDEISRSIVNELRLKLGRGQRRYTTDIQTYDLFLKARVLQARRAENARLAIELFDQVVKKDPAFAPAYAGVASTYGYLSYVFPAEGGFSVPPEQADGIMRSAAAKALELDPLLADAHAAMGQVHALAHEWTEAEASFRRALQLNPSLTSTYTDFALTTLLPEGKLDEATRLLETATRADPLSLDVRRVLVHVQIDAGLYDRAIDNCDRVLAVDPTFPFVAALRMRALLHKGRVTEAIAWMEREGAGAEGYLGYAYAVSGRRPEAEALAARNHDFPQRQAMIYAGLGDRDHAFEALERLAAINPRRTGAFLTRPELARLRGDPRMAALRTNLGLPSR